MELKGETRFDSKHWAHRAACRILNRPKGEKGMLPISREITEVIIEEHDKSTKRGDNT